MKYDDLPESIARRFRLDEAHIMGLHGEALATYGCQCCADEVRMGERAEPDPDTGEPVFRTLTRDQWENESRHPGLPEKRSDRMTTHKDTCTKPGFRYAATVRATKATVAAGTAGKVVMICKGCSATVLV